MLFRSRGLKWGAFVLFVLALLSKPMAVSLPFVILAIEIWHERRWRPGHYLRCFLPWLVAALAVMVITTHLQVWSKGKEMYWLRQSLVVWHNLGWYGISTFIPYELSPIYPRIHFSEGTILRTVGFYLAVGGGIWWGFRRLSRENFYFVLLPWLAVWLVMLGPVIGVFQIGFIDRADRYNYLPAAVLWFGVALGLNYGWKKHKVRLAVLFPLGVAATGYAGWMIYTNLVYLDAWRDFPTLIRTTCDRPHPSDIALIELGLQHITDQDGPGLYQVAAQFRDNKLEWMNDTDKLGQEILAAYFEGYAHLAMGDSEQAQSCFEFMSPHIDSRSLSKKGIFEDVMAKLFLIHEQKGDKAGATRFLNRLLGSYKDREKTFQYYFYAGVGELRQRHSAAALTFFRQGLQLKPDDANTQMNIKMLEASLQQTTARGK